MQRQTDDHLFQPHAGYCGCLSCREEAAEYFSDPERLREQAAELRAERGPEADNSPAGAADFFERYMPFGLAWFEERNGGSY